MDTGKILRKVFVLALAVMLALALATPSDAATKRRKAGTNNTVNPLYASIVIDADTGVVLHEKNADRQLHPASLVKMMTLLMTFDALESGSITMNSRVRISQHAHNQPPSKLGIPVGSTISVKDAIYALVTKSANDVAVALGETIGGNETRFVGMMNAKAREIGLTRTTFRNANGLHHPSQYSSARDMARLSRHLVMNYPRQYKFFSTRNFTYNGVSYHNHNRLMETYKGMDGIKTGYIQPSGFNLAASAVRNNHRVIAVVFGGRTSQSRNAHMADLLDLGFAQLGDGAGVRLAGRKSLDDALHATARPVKLAAAVAPLPGRKPIRRDMLQDSAPEQQLAAATPEAMNELIGEGDYDPVVARRFEAGMIAIAALKSDMVEPSSGTPVPIPPPVAAAPQAPVTPPVVPNIIQAGYTPPQVSPLEKAILSNDWSLQIGAYASRVRSDEALSEAIKKLPPSIRPAARPVIVPMKAGDGWVFRARLQGLSREQAMASCKYFQNCMAISPRTF